MAKLKMLKEPKPPKMGRKPKANSSLASKQAWLRRNADKKAKYEAKVRAVRAENAKRAKINSESERLHKVISGVSNVLEIRPSGFSAKIIRASKAKPRKAGKKKAAKRKPARKAAKRRR